MQLDLCQINDERVDLFAFVYDATFPEGIWNHCRNHQIQLEQMVRVLKLGAVREAERQPIAHERAH